VLSISRRVFLNRNEVLMTGGLRLLCTALSLLAFVGILSAADDSSSAPRHGVDLPVEQAD
jgi:hypothetical protein